MSGVEGISSTARSGRGWNTSPWRAPGLVLAVATAIASAVVCLPRPASAETLAQARSTASQLTTQLAADQNRFGVLNDAYDNALALEQQISNKIATTQAQMVSAQARVAGDQVLLRSEAIAAYTDGTGTGLNALFAGTGEQASITGEYRTVATGDLQSTLDTLHGDESHLAATQSSLTSEVVSSRQAVASAAADQQQAAAILAQQQGLLRGANSRVAALVAQQQAAAVVAAQQQAVIRIGPTISNSTPPPVGSGAGEAIAAAMSQRGMPYIWGGESPGRGFDCSGLVQWAWGLAGVGLPRTAAAQYSDTTHIPLSAMQPGDLVFWSDGGEISHVGIYIGGGEVVHAPSPGTVVQIAAIWGNGLVGAGRP